MGRGCRRCQRKGVIDVYIRRNIIIIHIVSCFKARELPLTLSLTLPLTPSAKVLPSKNSWAPITCIKLYRAKDRKKILKHPLAGLSAPRGRSATQEGPGATVADLVAPSYLPGRRRRYAPHPGHSLQLYARLKADICRRAEAQQHVMTNRSQVGEVAFGRPP
jgi:hypothetical protein